MSTNEPFSYFQPANDSPRSDHSRDNLGRPPRAEQPIWQHDIWDLLRAYGETEEGANHVCDFPLHLAYNSASKHCDTPSSIDTDHETWEASVRFMWED